MTATTLLNCDPRSTKSGKKINHLCKFLLDQLSRFMRYSLVTDLLGYLKPSVYLQQSAQAARGGRPTQINVQLLGSPDAT